MPAFVFFAVRRFLVALGMSAFRLMMACRISCLHVVILHCSWCHVQAPFTWGRGGTPKLEHGGIWPFANAALFTLAPSLLAKRTVGRCRLRMKLIPMWFKWYTSANVLWLRGSLVVNEPLLTIIDATNSTLCALTTVCVAGIPLNR